MRNAALALLLFQSSSLSFGVRGSIGRGSVSPTSRRMRGGSVVVNGGREASTPVDEAALSASCDAALTPIAPNVARLTIVQITDVSSSHSRRHEPSIVSSQRGEDDETVGWLPPHRSMRASDSLARSRHAGVHARELSVAAHAAA